jgi:CD109 antigen
MENDHETEVTLFNENQEFEFVEANENENSINRPKRALESHRKKTVLIKSNNGASISFMIRPLKVGQITIKVIAESAVAGDGVERQLKVEPEGITTYMNEAVFIDLRKTNEFKRTIEIMIPENAVPDSSFIEASAIGDILGPTIDNLDKLIKLPSGCGEQNMLNFVPNIVVLDYLKSLKKLNSEVESKTKNFLEVGYQRELSYKHKDGSYSAFGEYDKSGSTWLTAFVAKSFAQASRHVHIDKKHIKQALDFLKSTQNSNGSFTEVGTVCHKDMQGGSSNGIALTAYTLIAFLECGSKFDREYRFVISDAKDYIVKNFDKLEDNYSLAIAAYALQLSDCSQLKDLSLSKLISNAVKKDGMTYWEKQIKQIDEPPCWYERPRSVNVEMSAYALQALLAAGLETDAIPIMKWLVTQRNENGGFQSTQDTVVGLQALSKLAERISVVDREIHINLKNNQGVSTNINVNFENAFVLQKFEMASNARHFDVSASGKGFGILQISYKYNLNHAEKFPRFVLEPKVEPTSNKEFLHLSVCINFVPDEQAEKSNMAVMEVSLPSGFTFDNDHKQELLKTERVKVQFYILISSNETQLNLNSQKVETKDGDTVVIIYYDDIDKTPSKTDIKACRAFRVAKQKPAPIVIYDYYDTCKSKKNLSIFTFIKGFFFLFSTKRINILQHT